MAQEPIPGAGIVVLKAGQIVKVAAYGLTGTNRPVPTKPDSIFRIQSATKPFPAGAPVLVGGGGEVGWGGASGFGRRDPPVRKGIPRLVAGDHRPAPAQSHVRVTRFRQRADGRPE